MDIIVHIIAAMNCSADYEHTLYWSDRERVQDRLERRVTMSCGS